MSKTVWAIRVNPWDEPGNRFLIPDHGDAMATVGGERVGVWITRGGAHARASRFEDACNARLVRVTRKPKAPPPLRVGDEVTLKATLIQGPNEFGRYFLRMQSGEEFWVTGNAISEAAKEPG